MRIQQFTIIVAVLSLCAAAGCERKTGENKKDESTKNDNAKNPADDKAPGRAGHGMAGMGEGGGGSGKGTVGTLGSSKTDDTTDGAGQTHTTGDTGDTGGAAASGGSGEVGPPTAQDLAGYVADLEGKGKLMAKIETTEGTLNCVLFENEVPMTVANFVGLARGLKPWKHPRTGDVFTDRPYFDGIIFHRVIPDFMIQTGDPLGKGIGGPGYQFADEFHPKLRHDGPGIMSMANSGRSTNGSQFFITEKPTPHLDNKHSVFGRCAEVDIVKKIARVPKDPNDPNGSTPMSPVVMNKVTILRGK